MTGVQTCALPISYFLAERRFVPYNDVAVEISRGPPGKRKNSSSGRHILLDGRLQSIVANMGGNISGFRFQAQRSPHREATDAPGVRIAVDIEDARPGNHRVEYSQPRQQM